MHLPLSVVIKFLSPLNHFILGKPSLQFPLGKLALNAVRLPTSILHGSSDCYCYSQCYVRNTLPDFELNFCTIKTHWLTKSFVRYVDNRIPWPKQCLQVWTVSTVAYMHALLTSLPEMFSLKLEDATAWEPWSLFPQPLPRVLHCRTVASLGGFQWKAQDKFQVLPVDMWPQSI